MAEGQSNKDPMLRRRAYKGQLTTAKGVMLKYKNSPENLNNENAEQELIATRDMVGRIERKFEAVQMEIIQSRKTVEDKLREEEEMLSFLDECAAIELGFCQLLATFSSSTKPKDEEGAASGSADPISQLIALMSQQLNEQRQQRLSDDNKLQQILNAQREEIQKMLEVSRSEAANSSMVNYDESPQDSMNLEPIKIPSFGGSYCDWPTFKNLFVSSVHKNSRLSKSQKMQYLRTSTTDEALALFSSLPISDENYEVAWSRLVKRYDDKLIIIAAHMDRFLNQHTITKPTAAALRRLQSATTQALEAIDALQVTERDPWLIHLTLNHLDHQTRTLWSEKKPETVPTWKDFDEFLNTRCRSLEVCNSTQPTSKSNIHTTLHAADSQERENCEFCNLSPHRLYRCKKFLGLQPNNRLEIVNDLELCENCITDNHDIEICSFQSCKICNQKHNHLLHDAFVSSATPNAHTSLPLSNPDTNLEAIAPPFSPTFTTMTCSGRSGGVLLATAVVTLEGNNGASTTCRALLDPGSQLDIISASMCKKLKLQPTRANVVIEGVGANSHTSTQEAQVQLQVQGENHVLNCVVMEKVVGLQPIETIDIRNIPIPSHFTLADPNWFESQSVDLLIGGRYVWKFLGNGKFNLGKDLPMLFESSLGWLVVGPCHSHTNINLGACNIVTLGSVDCTIRKFWEIEDVPTEFFVQSEEVETQVRTTTSPRETDGRSMIMLPLKQDVQDLDNYRGVALRQLNHLNRNLAGVIRKDATTTEFQVVLNDSSQKRSGLRLNECMKIYPVVQPTLISILWRFGSHEMVQICDIIKMHRQVLMQYSHRDYQRFVWITDEHENEFSLATSVLNIDFYEDDCLFSAPTLEEVISAKMQLEDLLGGAGVQLSKSRMKRVEVLKSEDCSTTEHTLALNDEAKPLGWDNPHPADLLRKWHKFVTDLQDVDQIYIPRWISATSQHAHRTLNIFFDASNVHSIQFISNSKLMPINPQDYESPSNHQKNPQDPHGLKPKGSYSWKTPTLTPSKPKDSSGSCSTAETSLEQGFYTPRPGGPCTAGISVSTESGLVHWHCGRSLHWDECRDESGKGQGKG